MFGNHAKTVAHAYWPRGVRTPEYIARTRRRGLSHTAPRRSLRPHIWCVPRKRLIPMACTVSDSVELQVVGIEMFAFYMGVTPHVAVFLLLPWMLDARCLKLSLWIEHTS
ncbi:hypothetical protein L226DRAFT_76839 [Lentinus tigrinus ALCF2SS1-7]|uniref:Uncharacterized protein n=1 Tax=Lentinus tigrinus ALCF2SS1-6 TaxID=1328759 RepID=A0A5C2SFT1_9APHY|nr:hypothetical protein L227DRAFT_47512 [Lentinus tigrinus ALCF2SS1-6]RPD74525.1 hypothetical protein L226DRAFT_76839 [Lentinus tigrinus ALCF2SS1-7]